jgi:hypothetical protein
MPVIDFLLRNILPILIIGFVIYFFLNIYRFRKRIQQKQSSKEKDTSRIEFSFKGENHNDLSVSRTGQSAKKNGTGDEIIFDGITGGISWKLTSTILNIGSGTDRAWKSKSAWKTTEVVWPPGSFLVIMSTYGEIKSGTFKKTGLMNKILSFVAEQMLDIYIAGYFGSGYRELVGINEDGVVIKKDLLSDFFILTNRPEYAEKVLDDATVNTISSWKKLELGFEQENLVDNFGVLFAPDAMFVSCQTALRKPEEVKIFSDFASAMALKMKMQLH